MGWGHDVNAAGQDVNAHQHGLASRTRQEPAADHDVHDIAGQGRIRGSGVPGRERGQLQADQNCGRDGRWGEDSADHSEVGRSGVGVGDGARRVGGGSGGTRLAAARAVSRVNGGGGGRGGDESNVDEAPSLVAMASGRNARGGAGDERLVGGAKGGGYHGEGDERPVGGGRQAARSGVGGRVDVRGVDKDEYADPDRRVAAAKGHGGDVAVGMAGAGAGAEVGAYPEDMVLSKCATCGRSFNAGFDLVGDSMCSVCVRALCVC